MADERDWKNEGRRRDEPYWRQREEEERGRRRDWMAQGTLDEPGSTSWGRRDLDEDRSRRERERRHIDDVGFGRAGQGDHRYRYGREGERYGEGAYGYGGEGEPAHQHNQSQQRRDWWDKATDEVSSWFGDRGAEQRRDHDDRDSHRGKGPKGYRRSDERIREDVNDQLTDDPSVDASEVEVSVSNCEVTLTGTVNSRSERRRAEELAERVSGVSHVQNNLRVQSKGAVIGGSGL